MRVEPMPRPQVVQGSFIALGWHTSTAMALAARRATDGTAAPTAIAVRRATDGTVAPAFLRAPDRHVAPSFSVAAEGASRVYSFAIEEVLRLPIDSPDVVLAMIHRACHHYTAVAGNEGSPPESVTLLLGGATDAIELPAMQFSTWRTEANMHLAVFVAELHEFSEVLTFSEARVVLTGKTEDAAQLSVSEVRDRLLVPDYVAKPQCTALHVPPWRGRNGLLHFASL